MNREIHDDDDDGDEASEGEYGYPTVNSKPVPAPSLPVCGIAWHVPEQWTEPLFS